ncbi:ERAD-associated E3 ubiquitin-protein ligase HRD1, putative [Plasmodium knowlesi strain H]|uniref:RING-type E3 ubiquitin transferase n=3 Tax=Plasmodium knowlesi TaxID=5850 RepID=A0A1A7VLR0_PLAKH|nr:ERAD-associated E3 ubiquitin-protein ligase HRD1, putative [Plasmodium knowlesi strain H]OTN67853.1 putative ERAD-associated E3 ubiquitin-protein ligase HRD1 [Plasmodium knowlesi]CAA9990386.1 ERAD-associated E3 ubiquitin-protein ligase HRD1, putative [Plasmodium knowlesi strain H]SBO19592.1 ERAD-associated E3 ubiquitin-protein ligase HRD1, putative [Plasmodium knowlesi strain H]SBO22642.1 ERAD-associated E3 ubiquitin-protein ligase HRD1, putative [Plasmodium knowlesi strain H]VVS79860.1 ERA
MEVNMRMYILLSHLGLAFILMYSFMKYNEFYSAVVYLSTEKFPRTIIYNFFLMIFIILCKLLLNIFIGELRYLEVEQLIDNARAFIMDTILFLVLSKPTINGKEVSSIILIKYLSIIVILKAYHLVLYSRVSHIFELGVPRTKVLVKLFIFMCLLSVANLTLFTYFYKYSLKNSTMYLWLFFESLSIFESCQISIFKFFVNIIDLRSANGLSSKATILFFLDILHDILSLIIFLVFILVFILNNFSNLPLHMTADIIHVVKTLISRFKSFQRYRELTKNIETKFPDATEEELREVGTCIICRDDLKEGSKKLSCSHIFHVECLKSWFIQQQTCPICRTEIKPQSSKENTQNEAIQKEQEQQEEEGQREKKINQLTIQEIITKASFLPIDKNSSSLNDSGTENMFLPKEDDSAVFGENMEIKQRIKILADLCDYYRELCLTCLKEIDKINYTAVPANVMLRNIYGSLNYNVLNNAEEDEVKKYLTKISHVPQMSVFKSYLERVLIDDMKYTKEICSLM